MKDIWGKVTIETNTDEIAYINELLKRDRAVMATKHKGNLFDYYKCGICNKYVNEDAIFCQHCGQRIDQEHLAF